MVSFSSKSHYSSSASSVSASSFNVRKLHKQVIYVKNNSCSSIEQSGSSMAVSPGGSTGGSSSSVAMMATTTTSSSRVLTSTDRPLMESAASITTIGTTDASTTSSSPVTVSVDNGLGSSTDGSNGSLADLERNVLRINEWNVAMPFPWVEPFANTEYVIALWFRICIYSFYLLYSV